LDDTVYLGTSIALGKGPDEGVLARAWDQAAERDRRSTGHACLLQSLSHLADETAGCPRALVDAKYDRLCSTALSQVGRKVGQSDAFGEHDQELCRWEAIGNKLFWVVDDDGQSGGAVPHDHLPVRRCAGV
jgi:hypothetical protein